MESLLQNPIVNEEAAAAYHEYGHLSKEEEHRVMEFISRI